YEDDSYTYSFEQTVKQSLKNITSSAKTYNFQGYAADGWTATSKGTQPDVPEPTSGILLLVGGAMLALRRKRA
ncbi:MAG: PEP-CTERM sorting domain-containing protein, partial [Kiritimatiellae bacterium]|nr:PEP-CTERM sorting domain-containing protein [Kiritimatiellia bacterium]